MRKQHCNWKYPSGLVNALGIDEPRKYRWQNSYGGGCLISSLSFGYVDLKILSKIKRLVLYSLNDYRKSSINPPGGLFISSPFEGGLNRDGGLIGEGGGGAVGYLI